MQYLTTYGEGGNRRSSQQRIRGENLKRLFNLLNKYRETSRSDLARITGLSPTTVSALVETLMQEDLAVEVGYVQTALTGRKPISLRMNAEGRQFPVFTISRSEVRYTLYNLLAEEIETIVVPLDSAAYGGFEPGAENRFPDAGKGYCRLFKEILLQRSRCFDPARAAALCLTYPGVYRQDIGELYMSVMRVSISRAELNRLGEELKLPVFIGTVAQSFAYAQKKHLESRDSAPEEMIFVAVRNGVGIGIVDDGEVFTGRNHFAGEIGHITINHRGRPCMCGGRGCLERYVSIDAIIGRIAQVVSFHPCASLPSAAEEITLEMIGAAYDAGETEIIKTVNEIAEQFFAGLNSAACLTGIRRMYVGGGIERLGRGFLKQLQRLGTAAENGMRQGLQVEYGSIAPEDVGRGTVQYYIDHVFEVGQ